MPSGLDEVTRQLKKHSGIISDLGFNLATQRSLWGAIGETIKYKVLGPAGSLTGTFFGIQQGIKAMVRESGTLEAAWQRVSQIKIYQGQFESLLKGATQARARLAGLARFSNGRLFRLDETARTSRGLEILTRGAMGGADSLNTVADAARVSGESLEDAGEAIGTFYRALQDGNPVEAVAGRLERMGLLTRGNVQELARLQQTGAPLASQFSTFQNALAGNTRQSEKFEESLEGLRQKYEQTRERLAARFGQPFLEGERKGMAASIRIAENLEGPVGAVADNFARVVNFGSGFTKQIGAAATSIPGLTFAAGAASKAFIGLIGLGTSAGAVQAGARLIALGRAGVQGIRSFDAAAMAGRFLARATVAREVAAGGTGIASLFNAGKAIALEGAAAGVARAPGIGAGILGALGRGAGAVARYSGIAAVAATGVEIIEAQHKANVARAEQKKSNLQIERSLGEQIGAMRSADDAQQALIDSTNRLTVAREKLQAIQQKGDGILGGPNRMEAQRHLLAIQSKQTEIAVAMESGNLEPSQGSREQMQRRAQRELALGQMERESLIGRSTGYERASLLESEAQRAAADSNQAQLYDSEKARLASLEQTAATNPQLRLLYQDENGKSAYGPALQALTAARRSSPSEVIREEQRLAEMREDRSASPGEIASAETQFSARKDYLLSQSPGRSRELREAADRARLEAGMHEAEIVAEEKLNALRQIGRQREEGGAQARIDAMKQQSALLAGFGDKQGARGIDARVVAAERELALMKQVAAMQRQSDAAHAEAVSMQQRAAVAAARGQFAEAARLRNAAVRKEDAAEERRRAFELKNSGQYSKEEAERQAAAERSTKEQDRLSEAAVYRIQKSREFAEDQLALTGKEADIQKLARLRDQDAFRQRIQEGLAAHLSPEEATKFAYHQTSLDLQRSALEFDRSHVVDSLQRIGGGGGVSQDLGLDYAQRQTSLLEEARNHLRQIAKGGDDSPKNEAKIDDGGF